MRLNHLPQRCYTTSKTTGETIMVLRGEMGYFQDLTCTLPDEEIPEAKELNEMLGVTPEEVDIMVWGSMFGWNTPLVQDFGKDLEDDSNYYDDERQTILNDPS